MTKPFSSTDDERSAKALQHAKAVTFDGPVGLESGKSLPSVTCVFETWGELNAERSNAVLICHAISGDSHAARHDDQDDLGWWDALIGPGKPIDTNRFFVVCPNVLGGCRGSTGPGSINPETGKPYGADFPVITIGDIVMVQHMLAESLGIDRWRAVVGGSLGGHQAMTWIKQFPGSADSCIIIASSPRLTSQAISFDVIARNAIQTDPHFSGGQYYDKATRPDKGLAIARMLGHITYLSNEAMSDKFEMDRHDPRQIESDFEQRFSVGSYLAHQGQKFTTRFDANSYVTLSMAMDLFDLGSTRLQLMEAFDESDCDFLLVSFSSDWLFTPQQSRDIVNALAANRSPVSYVEITSTAGHDSFLIDEHIRSYGPMIASRLGLVTHASTELSDAEERIMSLVPPESSILDLGCGDGHLLSAFQQRGHRDLVGVEVSTEEILQAVSRGLNVIDYDLNKGLPAFVDKQFDYVIVSATLQAIANISELFDEMLRVGKHVVVHFSNFAHRTLRDDYVARGRSPKASVGQYSYEWYDTPNRRFPSIADVQDLCEAKDASIEQAYYFDSASGMQIAPENNPNLNADSAVLVLARD